MSYLAYSAAPFDQENNQPQNESRIDRKRNTRQTIKRKPSENVATARQQIMGFSSMDDDAGDMADFTPPSKPVSVGSMRVDARHTENDSPVQPTAVTMHADAPVNQETFSGLPSQSAEDYYRQFVPYYDRTGDGSAINRDELGAKLDYLITILEEQQDIKTGRVTEEIILYSFLGVFIIFVLDSFARAGKYVR